MKITELPRLFSPQRWALVGIIVLVAILAIWWVLTEPGRANQRAAEARADGAFSTGRTSSAVEAGKIAGAAHQAAQASEALSRETADVLRQAPGAAERLDPELNRIARERLCLRAAYREHPICAVQQPGR